MTDEQLAAFVPDLIRWEGSVRHMYRDSLGYVTVGIGNLVHDAGEAAKLPFETVGRPATAKEVGDDFLRVIALAKGMPAAQYRSPTPPHIELPDAGVQGLAISRLRHEFLPGLSRLFIGFDGLPAPVQSALVDIAWNTGISGIAQFSHLRDAVSRCDWNAAADSCHRKTSREERNQWAADLFRSAA